MICRRQERQEILSVFQNKKLLASWRLNRPSDFHGTADTTLGLYFLERIDMNKRRFWLFSTLAIALLAVHFSAAAEQAMYVQSAKANLMTGPGFDTELVTVLQKGDAVTMVKEQGRWVQVTLPSSSGNGWMSKLLLGNQPPMKKVSVLKGKQEQLEKSARRRASASASAAATRGLRDDERVRMNDADKPDYNELQNMEAVEVKEAEVRAFYQEGLSQ